MVLVVMIHDTSPVLEPGTLGRLMIILVAVVVGVVLPTAMIPCSCSSSVLLGEELVPPLVAEA